MFRRISIPALFLAALVAWSPVCGGAEAPDTRLRDMAGKVANPFGAEQAKGARLLVFIFLRVDCPVANVYAPEISRLAKEYGAKGVAFRLVYCDPDETPEVIGKHLADFEYAIPALRDPELAFAKRSRVKVTPEAAVYQADGSLIFHGRIDDRYADYGKARPQPTVRDLAQALDAALAGKKVPAASGPAVGCFIEGM